MLGLAAFLAQPTDPSKEPPTRPLSKLFFTINNIHSINVPTALLSFTSLGFLIIVRVIKQKITQRPGGNWVRYVPEILILVVGTTSEFVLCYVNGTLVDKSLHSSNKCAEMGRKGS